MTVGETAGVTIEEAQKYAGEDRNELNMVFQFEHVESGCGDYGKWTTEKYDFKEFKRIMIKWQEELAGKAFKLAKKITTRLKDVLGCDGYNIVQNNGEVAGQTVFHFHMHIIPRYKGDTANIKWVQNEVDQAVVDEIISKAKDLL